MAKRKRPGSPQPPQPPRSASAWPPIAPPSADPFDDLDIEPLLMAFQAGLLDDHLEDIAKLVNQRFRVIDAADELVAAARLHVGDHVRLGHNIKPQYLHGQAVTIIARDGEKWVVRLDEPIGRFTDADLRVMAIQLEPG